jgi:ribosomal protein L22
MSAWDELLLLAADEGSGGGEDKPKRRRRRKPADEQAEKPKRRTRRKAEPPAGKEADTPAEEAPGAATAEAEAAEQEEEAAPAPNARRGRAAPEDEGGGDEEAAPKPEPRRRRSTPTGPPPAVRAQARYVRTSARKARLVCDHIRGKSVDEARAILEFSPREVARDWQKLLESAVANAEHNHELVGDDLRILDVRADEGPTLKRYRPRAMGRATRIRKRTSHLSITLKPRGEE